jgi:hypothetical protein
MSLVFIIKLFKIVAKLTRPKSNTHINKFRTWDYRLSKNFNSYTIQQGRVTPRNLQIQMRTSTIATSILEL